MGADTLEAIMERAPVAPQVMSVPDAGWGASRIESRYTTLMQSAAVRSLVRQGGRVFVATEGRGADLIEALITLGHRDFAEKRIQETRAKWPAIRARHVGLRLHGFGRLQTNKAGGAVDLFDALESLDRERLARRLHWIASTGRRLPDLYVQVNTGSEPQKGGLLPEAADGFVAWCRGELGLTLVGAMAIPPRQQDPLPHFRWLRAFADRNRLAECVMGMSADYAAAIACGATAIRVGRAMFAAEAQANAI